MSAVLGRSPAAQGRVSGRAAVREAARGMKGWVDPLKEEKCWN